MRVDELPIPLEAKQILKASGIIELYPPQEDAFKAGALEGKNLVLASPTASGKTLVAELCAIKQVVEGNGKVLYLTPLRALASEKYHEFQKWVKIVKRNGRGIRIAISTGDYDSSDRWLEKYDIIICTNEKADSLLRHRSRWISMISLVVADEIHLLNDSSRGPTLEVILSRLMQINPKAQILTLSATIKNADEIADWLKSKSVTRNWRPVKLVEGVYLHGVAQFNDGSSYRINENYKNPSTNLAFHIVKHGGQVLIFTGTRKEAVSMARRTSSAIRKCISKPEERMLSQISKRVLAAGEQTRISELLANLIKWGVAFHHAGLSPLHRKIIEDSFRDGKIKVVTATPTLAFGVNLPARMVVVNNYLRYEPVYGRYPIPVFEYKQMAGRAGRPKYDKVGEALLIADSEDEQDFLMEKYILAEPEKIWSKLAVESVLRSHVLATIASGFSHTEESLFDFFDRTFYAHQYGTRYIRRPVSKVLKFLYDEKMIAYEGKNLYATEFGRRVSELYIDPISGVIIREGLYNRADSITEVSFLHMICHTQDVAPKFYPRASERNELLTYVDIHRSEFMFKVPDEWNDRIQYEEFLGEVKCTRVLDAWINESSEDMIIERYGVEPGDLFRLTQIANWLLYASYELAKLFGHKDLLSKMLELRNRVKSGVKKELIPLVRLQGIGRIRGRILFNSGFKTTEDLKRATLSELSDLPLIGSRLARKIKEQVGGLVKPEEWERLKGEESWEQRRISEY